MGESGSGKSVSAMSILRLLDGNGYIDSGEIILDGDDLIHMDESGIRHIRGNKVSVIFQEPMTSLNPVFSIEKQIGEVLQIHQGMTKAESRLVSIDLLREVGIPNPEKSSKVISSPIVWGHASTCHDCDGTGVSTRDFDC